MAKRWDPRPLHRKLEDRMVVLAYIVGLSTMTICWALLAWATIGNQTMHHPDYHLSDPTPAAQPYNSLTSFPSPRR